MASDRADNPPRPLVATPVATLLAILALALLLASHVGSFAVVSTVLLRVLPVEDLDRLVHIWDNIEINPGERHDYSVKAAHYLEWKKRQTTLARMGAFEPLSFNLTGVGDPVRLQGALISHDLLHAFGVEPLLGRNVGELEDRPGAPPVALLSHDLWHDRFAGDPDVVGRSIQVDGRAHTVIGVMPPGFYHPWHSQIWISQRLDPESPKFEHGSLTVIGFMKPDVTIEEVRADFRDVASQLEREFPETNTGWRISVNVLRNDLVGEIQPKLLAFLVVSLLLVLAACSPLALLLAIRRQPAADNGRGLVALLPTGLLYAVVAGLLGYLVAVGFTETVVGISPLVVFTSYFKTIHFDLRVGLYALGIVLLTGLLLAAFGARLRRGRFVAGLAFALLVLSLAVTTWTSFDYFRQANADYGFPTDGLLAMRFSLPDSRYSDPQTRRDFFTDLLNRVRRLPGVTSAGVTTDNPFAMHTRSARHSVEGYQTEPGTVLVVHHRLVSPGYLETLGVEELAGRLIEAGDDLNAPKVAVVNRTFAERYWPGESALGKRVKQGNPDSDRPWLTVVGVVGDIQEDGREASIHRPTWYLPAAQYDDLRIASLVARAAGDPQDLAAPIRGVVAEIDPEQPVYDVLTIEQFRDRFTLFRPRFLARISGLATVLVFVLAVAAFAARRAVSNKDGLERKLY